MDNYFYPPYIEEKLPAQYGDTLSFELLLNRANDINIQDTTIHLQVKTISTNIVEFVLHEYDSYEKITDNKYKIIFSLPADNSLHIGQYYKAQIAFGDSAGDNIGNYSNVGIFKYSCKPTITLQNSLGEELGISSHYLDNCIIALYENQDLTEKLYSYQLTILKDNEPFISTDKIIHNYTNDSNNSIIFDKIILKKFLIPDHTYKIIYSVETNNDIIEIIEKESQVKPLEDFPFSGDLLIDNTNLYDNSYFNIYIKVGATATLNDTFQLLRTDSKSYFSDWEVLTKYTFNNQFCQKDDKILIYRDFALEQGESYCYAIQKINNNTVSQLVMANTLENNNNIYSLNCYNVDFEDAFLYDGERQLKIRYNPKITNFKNIIPEQKIETIGNQYPYFFRNKKVRYKEFQISGLISLLMNDNYLFNNLYSTSSNLIGENIYKERQFKLDVLKWLNNGKPKLFKSGPEGNYIVQLTNISLSPNDTLGRMIHTFSSTATEIDTCNITNLKKYNIITENSTSNQLKTNIVYFNNNMKEYDFINQNIIAARLKDLDENSQWKITFTDLTTQIIKGNPITKIYSIFIPDNVSIKSIECLDDKIINAASIEYQYYNI